MNSTSVLQVDATVSDATSAIKQPATITVEGDATSYTLNGTYGGTSVTGTVNVPLNRATAGLYDVCVNAQDVPGNPLPRSCSIVAVYDPAAGFVTGGGWIYSPQGALTLNAGDELLEGRAEFGFVSRYKTGASTPSGNTAFEFKLGKFKFHSTAYEWLVISGARAQYKGTGAVNGGGDYGFMLTAVDSAVNGGGNQDQFRIKVWERATGRVVYDNMLGAGDEASLDNGTIIRGGSIVIHKK